MYAIFLLDSNDAPDAEVYCICLSENGLWAELDYLDGFGVGYTYRKVM